jgi:two-component system, LuxR family, sensor kinase FixL
MFSKGTLALMQAAVDAIIVIDHRGRMAALNDAAGRMFGYRVDELLSENVSILMPEPDRSAHDGFLARHLETGNARIIGIGREITAQRKDGTTFPARLSVGRIADSGPPRFVGIVRDVSAERDASAALKLERDRANAYLELNDAILLMLDTERRIVEINARGSDILGAPSVDLHGRDWLQFMNDESERERGRLLLHAALSGTGSREREFDSRGASGDRLRIHWRSIARRDADGSPAGWLCAGVDVTEQALRAEDAHLAQERLTRVARLATMGEMAAGVAHELNQPLTAIATYARAAERSLEKPVPDLAQVQEVVREINAEGLRAGEIIRRLRQMVRTDAPEQRTAEDVNALVNEIHSLIAADARVHDARLRVALTKGLPRVMGNAVQLQQVVLNLLRNALEALGSKPRGTREVEISTHRTVDGQVEIQISDNGPGVDASVADRLFEPFCTTKGSGTGLGLAISRTIAHAHGGTIGTRPVNPHGACFFLRLPVVEDEYK